MNKITNRKETKLTSERQELVKYATGKTITTLNIDLASLSDQSLEKVTGGIGGGSNGIPTQAVR